VTFLNTGDTTWRRFGALGGYKLGSQSPQDNLTWGLGRVPMPTTRETPPGELMTFAFNITAPLVPGTYLFQWRMVLEGVHWFGELTPQIPIVVTLDQGLPSFLATFPWDGQLQGIFDTLHDWNYAKAGTDLASLRNLFPPFGANGLESDAEYHAAVALHIGIQRRPRLSGGRIVSYVEPYIPAATYLESKLRGDAMEDALLHRWRSWFYGLAGDSVKAQQARGQCRAGANELKVAFPDRWQGYYLRALCRRDDELANEDFTAFFNNMAAARARGGPAGEIAFWEGLAFLVIEDNNQALSRLTSALNLGWNTAELHFYLSIAHIQLDHFVPSCNEMDLYRLFTERGGLSPSTGVCTCVRGWGDELKNTYLDFCDVF
jgi:hypothetical protein